MYTMFCGVDESHERHEFLVGVRRFDCPGMRERKVDLCPFGLYPDECCGDPASCPANGPYADGHETHDRMGADSRYIEVCWKCAEDYTAYLQAHPDEAPSHAVVCAIRPGGLDTGDLPEVASTKGLTND